MRDFIELRGASGAGYRFRLWPEGSPHQPIAGNYALVREEGDGVRVLLVGQSMDLSRVRSEWPKGLRKAGAQIYTRLNVSRAVRAAEHEDLAAHYSSARAVSGSE